VKFRLSSVVTSTIRGAASVPGSKPSVGSGVAAGVGFGVTSTVAAGVPGTTVGPGLIGE
jgi:hypothetical protein